MTGPYSIFEGPMAMNKIMGMELEHNWKHEEEFELIPKCILKKYNAEVHSQSLIEGMLELVNQNNISPSLIEEITATTFLTSYHIIGGGEYGDRKVVVTKEQADHSLPYLLAVACIDREVNPRQFLHERINREDVQELLNKVTVTTKFPLKEPRKLVSKIDAYTEAYPNKMMGKLDVKMKDGKKFSVEKSDYHGFFTRPLDWTDVEQKFRKLTEEMLPIAQQEEIISLVHDFENHSANKLISLIGKAESRAVRESRQSLQN
jgi:2-methylcitrate dehydratase